MHQQVKREYEGGEESEDVDDRGDEECSRWTMEEMENGGEGEWRISR